MPRGMGRNQKNILAILAQPWKLAGVPAGWYGTGFVCAAVYGDAPTESQRRAYRASLAKLKDAGLIKRGHLKGKQRDYMLTLTDAGRMATGVTFGKVPDPPCTLDRANEAYNQMRRQEYAKKQATIVKNAMMRAVAAGATPEDMMPEL